MMHKSRVMAHRKAIKTEEQEQKRQEIQVVAIETRSTGSKRRRSGCLQRDDEMENERLATDTCDKKLDSTSLQS